MPEVTNDTGAEHVLADIAGGDKPIPLSELPDHPAVPKKRGERMHISAVFRWASRGLRGHRLETARCGGVIDVRHHFSSIICWITAFRHRGLKSAAHVGP